MIMDMEKKGKHCHKIKNTGAVFGSVYLTGTSQKYCLVLLGLWGTLCLTRKQQSHITLIPVHVLTVEPPINDGNISIQIKRPLKNMFRYLKISIQVLVGG